MRKFPVRLLPARLSWPRKTWLLRGLAGGLALGAAAVLGVALTLAVMAASLPLDPGIARQAARISLSLRAADGSPLGTGGAVKGDPVTLAELPPHVVKAVLAIEDRRFFDHGGVDVFGIARAALANLRAGAITEGGSTITQQLARAAFLSSDRTLKRKIQEAMIAVWLEHRLSKEQILERYLGSVYFGAGAWGIDGAARRYFAKSARDLTLPEAAMLAGVIAAPSSLAPTRNPRAAQARAAMVLDAMVQAGWLTAAEAAQAKKTPAVPDPPQGPPAGSYYFADWAAGETAALLNPGSGAAVVETTLVPALQHLAEQAVREVMAARAADGRAGQAALVALSTDGAVLAMVGGRDYDASQFNRAVQAHRQAGSLFKLFVYLAALEEGFSPDSEAYDQPVAVGDWQPENYDQTYRGWVSLRDAFALSLNSVAVQLASEIGWGRVAAQARGMGIESPLLAVPALSLGAADVTLLEMTAAYAAVAADARRIRPYGVRRIVLPDHVLDLRRDAPPPATWDRRQALDLLGAVMRHGTASAQALDDDSYGKTGTSQEHRDAWFVGFSGELVVGVWVGNDDNSPMDGVTGARLPAVIWHDFMVAAEPVLADLQRHGLGRELVSVTTPDLALAAKLEPQEAIADDLLAAAALRGVPQILDTGTIAIAGEVVRLHGVQGDPRYARQMQQFIAGREVACTPVGGDRHRCTVAGQDLSRVVLYNGGAVSLSDAPPPLRDAERRARQAGRGLWGG